MSENSSISNNSTNNVQQKKVSYSTDYMVEYLKDSTKAPTNNKSEIKQNYDSDTDIKSNNSDLSKYLTSDNQYNNHKSDVKSDIKTDKSHTKNNEYHNTHNTQNNQNNQNNHNEQNNQQNDKTPEENEDFDNYNELSPEQQMLKKLDMLRKLGELAQYGVKLSQNYNMNSDYFTMKYEYHLHTNIRSKQNFINWTSSIMLNCIYGLEILNKKYDPFSLKLTDWSTQINADITSYYDIFGEIYEKYNKPGKSMSPELKLILMIGGSALKFHLSQVAITEKLNHSNQYDNQQFQQTLKNQQNQQNLNPQLLEQMRLQAIEQTKKQNEILMEKTNNEHNLANRQVKDMIFLQQKKEELAKFEAEKNQRMQDFEKTKAMLEAKNNNNNMQQALNQNQFEQNEVLETYRRANIATHLGDMKKIMLNTGMNINMGLSREELELPAHELYRNQASNVIHRKKTNLNIDPMIEQQLKQKEYLKKSNRSNSSAKSESNTSTKSESNSSVKSKSNTTNSSTKSETNISESSSVELSSSEPKKNSKIEKSLSSKNNFSTMSKRRYKKSGLTVDTS